MYGSSRKSYIITLSGKFRLLRLENEDKSRLEKNLKKIIFIIGCMSHPEKATSSCYLGNY